MPLIFTFIPPYCFVFEDLLFPGIMEEQSYLVRLLLGLQDTEEPSHVLKDLREFLRQTADHWRHEVYNHQPKPLYMVGGSGHVYTEKEIRILEFLAEYRMVAINTVVSKYDDLAYCHGNSRMIEFLLGHGADKNAERYDGRKPNQMGRVHRLADGTVTLP